MVVAFYFRLHLAYFPRPVVAIFARPEHVCATLGFSAITKINDKSSFRVKEKSSHFWLLYK